MSIEILSRHVGDTEAPIVTNMHGTLSGAVLMLEAIFAQQMAIAAAPSSLTLPSTADMIAALDADRPAIIVPSEGQGADPRDLEIFIRTWKADR